MKTMMRYWIGYTRKQCSEKRKDIAKDGKIGSKTGNKMEGLSIVALSPFVHTKFTADIERADPFECLGIQYYTDKPAKMDQTPFQKTHALALPRKSVRPQLHQTILHSLSPHVLHFTLLGFALKYTWRTWLA